jgi:hypothetical protein
MQIESCDVLICAGSPRIMCSIRVVPFQHFLSEIMDIILCSTCTIEYTSKLNEYFLDLLNRQQERFILKLISKDIHAYANTTMCYR